MRVVFKNHFKKSAQKRGRLQTQFEFIGCKFRRFMNYQCTREFDVNNLCVNIEMNVTGTLPPTGNLKPT
jgi:hypothetical protein